MINPFDLHGPQFLLFYLLFGTAVVLVLRSRLNSRERGDGAGQRICTDPYKLAALRSGATELLKVVIFSLIDRGLLKAAATEVKAAEHARDIVRRPVERAVVEFFSLPRDARELLADPAAMGEATACCNELAAEGLLLNETIKGQRFSPVLAALLLLIGTASAKIVIALGRGRHNIAFLVVLCIIFSVLVLAAWQRRRTGAGDEVLEKACRRFRPLKKRAASIRPGGMTNEATYLAALFGLAVLPAPYFPYLATIFPRPVSNGGSSGGCSGGGCSGGCGGGGCGGCGG